MPRFRHFMMLLTLVSTLLDVAVAFHADAIFAMRRNRGARQILHSYEVCACAVRRRASKTVREVRRRAAVRASRRRALRGAARRADDIRHAATDSYADICLLHFLTMPPIFAFTFVFAATGCRFSIRYAFAAVYADDYFDTLDA